MTCKRAVVLVIRDPDFSNEFVIDGSARIIDVDLGQSFNGSSDFDPESDEGIEWLAARRAEVANLPATSKVRRALEKLCNELERENDVI